MSLGICFGNLTPERLAERMGWEFTPSELEWLKAHRIENASDKDILAGDGYHIFDMPFVIYVSPTAEKKLVEILESHEKKSRGREHLKIVRIYRKEEL